MNPRKETIRILLDHDFVFTRSGGNHDIYFNPKTKVTIPIKRHDFDEDDMRYILKEANLDRQEVRNQKGKRKGK